MDAIGRQIQLPVRKAIEIAWKDIRRRLPRSVLVTGGIVLALAFLMSILAGDAILGSIRAWRAGAVTSDRMEVRQKAQKLEAVLQSNGVATESSDVRNSRIQTRWLVAIALLVAFVGILNAMLMSVTERFREIGTMKCLGALDGFIVKLFLIESLFQGVVGTTVGIGLGLVLGLAAALVNYGSYVWVNFPVGVIAMQAGICLIIGITLTAAAAVYPAWQAARMQPVEAMRVEA